MVASVLTSLPGIIKHQSGLDSLCESHSGLQEVTGGVVTGGEVVGHGQSVHVVVV